VAEQNANGNHHGDKRHPWAPLEPRHRLSTDDESENVSQGSASAYARFDEITTNGIAFVGLEQPGQ
jgi:hypothetical protein